MKTKIQKIIAGILLAFVTLVACSPVVQALENENYKFLDGGEPQWIDQEYDISFSDGNGRNLTLTGSFYAQYDISVLQYVSNGISLKNESGYHGLAGWSGIIFIEPKGLKPGINKIMWTDNNSSLPDNYITNKDKSVFGIDIICGENDLCTMNIYAGNDWYFPQGDFPGHYFDGRALKNGKMIGVKDFTINRATDPDFLIFSTVEISDSTNHQTNYDESRIKLTVDVETKPGSGILRKVTETTRLTARTPSSLIYGAMQGTTPFSLNFLNYTKVYSISSNILSSDISKIDGFIAFAEKLPESAYQMYESYFRYMQNNMYGYLLNLGFKNVLPTKTDLENSGIDTKGIDWDKLKKGETDFEFQKCGDFEVGCHIKNGVGYLGYSIGKLFSNIWNGFFDIVKSIFLWIWNGAKKFFDVLLLPVKGVVYVIDNLTKIVSDYLNRFLFPKWQYEKIICDKNFNYQLTEIEAIEAEEKYKEYVKSIGGIDYLAPFANNIVTLIRFINPIPPYPESQICTYYGLREVRYHANSWIDIIFVMIFTSMTLVLFIKRSE